jgi:hypothetical protein
MHNLGEDLITISTLTSFLSALETLAYVVWEARIKELTTYVQCRTDTAHSRSRSIIQGAGTTTVHQGGAAAVAAHPDAMEPAAAGRVQPRAAAL